MANSVTLLDASNNVIGTFATIQAAVNAAGNGDTVQIAAGTYQEQVTVNGLTNLTIEGAGQGQTIILSPDYTNLVSNIQNPGEFHTSTDALVGIENGASVTVKNLTVDGNNQGVIYAVGANGGGNLVGIEGVNSSLNVSNVHVTGTEDVEGGVLQGGQGNKGVIVNDTNSSTQTFTMTGSTVENFQKAGILMEGTGLTVNVNNDVVTGVGGNPTNISQNLIEIEHGAIGSITHNFVTGVSDGAGGSIGILMFQSGSGVTVSNNTVLGLAGNVNSAGIYFAGVDAPVAEGNSIANQGLALADDGSFDAFTTALLQDNNIYIGDLLNYYFFAGPTSMNAWTVTGTGGPDDLEGGAKNDVFTVTGVAPNGNIFVGNAGIDTVEGYGAGYHVAIQNNHWVVTNGTVTDTLTGIERVVINGQTHNLRAQDDFLGNAVSDILFRNDASGDTWFEAMSNGAFAGWNQIGGSDTSYTAAGVGDFDGTGTSDVLFRNNSTGDTWFAAISNGAFAGWNQIGGSDTNYSVVGVGDFFSNDTDDILFRNNSTGDTWIEAMSNGAFAGWYQVGGSDTHYAAVGVGDFFGNGTDDILYRNNSTGDTWIEAISNGAFDGWHQVGGSDTNYAVVGVGDFYGSGTDDVLFRNNSTGDTRFEAISNGAFDGWHQVGGSDTNYAVVGVGDYFGNGTDDILFRNNSTGDTWFAAMSNGAFNGWNQIGGSNTSYTVKT